LKLSGILLDNLLRNSAHECRDESGLKRSCCLLAVRDETVRTSAAMKAD